MRKKEKLQMIGKRGINTRHTSSVSIKDSTSGITLIALVITIIVLIILAEVSINAVMNEGLITNAKYSSQVQRATYIQEQINLTVFENSIKEYSSGEIITKEVLVERLLNEGYLKTEEATILNEEDIIEIDGMTVDFSILKSNILISPNNLFIETKENGVFGTGELKAELKNLSGEVTWEIISGTEYISLQEDNGENITVEGKAKGVAKIVAKCEDFTSAPCTVIISDYYVKNDSELKNAINAVEENDTICLAPGVYQEEIVLHKNNSTPLNNVSILGTGDVVVSSLDLKGSQNILIQGIKFDVSKAIEAKNYNDAGQEKNKYYASIYDNNIAKSGAKNIIIKDCIFEGNAPTGKNYICIYNNDQGFSNIRSTNFEINGCKFNCNAFAYVDLGYTAKGDIKILNNLFGGNEYSTSYANIFFSTTLSNLTVINNTFTNWGSGNVAIELMGPSDSTAAPENIAALTATNNTFHKTTTPADNEKAITYKRGRADYNVSNNEYTGNISYLSDSTSVTHTLHKSLQT